jgi:hypothetical protein
MPEIPHTTSTFITVVFFTHYHHHHSLPKSHLMKTTYVRDRTLNKVMELAKPKTTKITEKYPTFHLD